MEEEDWTQVVKQPEERKIFEALADSRWDFRTVDGVSTSTGLSRTSVREILFKYPTLIRLSPVRDIEGRELFTLTSRGRSIRELYGIARAFITKSTST